MNTHHPTGALASHMARIVATQRTYFTSNATRSADFRIAQLQKLKQLLLTHEAALHDAIYLDFGKSKYENQLIEFLPIIHEIDTAITHLRRWMRPKKKRTNLMNFPGKSYMVSEPLGVSLIIGAWNLPYNLTLTPLIGSIAAGNTTIVKPSELSTHTSACIAKLLTEHFDAAYITVVEGGIPETTALLAQRFDKIFFTGSPTVGRIVNEAAATHLTNVTLELGGKNPALFTKGAQLSVGVQRLIWAKFVNAGQFCITADYVLVHADQKDAFLARAVEEIEKSNFSLENHNYVRIINERNFNRVVSLIDADKVYYGGTHDRDTRIISPTILHNVTPQDAIMQEEVFGPILPVLTYETIDDAFALIRHMETPLAAYIYTEDTALAQRFVREIPAGSMAINDSVMQIANPYLPFGGVGNSGMGRYHGSYSFACFSHEKAILEKPTWFEPPFKYYGYTEKTIQRIRKFL